MALLVETYQDAGGKTPALLIHDEVHGGEMIGLMARYSKDLPAHVIPLAMHSAARTGHDTLVAAFALADQVFVLLDPEKVDENALSTIRSPLPAICLPELATRSKTGSSYLMTETLTSLPMRYIRASPRKG